MNMMKTIALSATAAAALTLGFGCQQVTPNNNIPFYPGERTGDVTLYRDMQFDDIAVPAEYMLIRNKSHSFQGSLFRSGVFHYEGPLDWSDAIAFYRKQMPTGGWTMEGFNRNYGFVEIRYRKGPEQLIVVVRQEMWGSRTEIQLDNIEKNDLLLKGKLSSEANP